MTNTLYIKNMVCDRCRTSVSNLLDELGLSYHRIDLGEVDLNAAPKDEVVDQLRSRLALLGFELIEDRTSRIISKVKSAVIDLVRGKNSGARKLKLSNYLSEIVGKDYPTISTLFSSVEGTTIGQYYIHQKIEYVKELLAYDELSLNEIADQLNYSSVQHLSNQFKKITGLTPSHFKTIGRKRRVPIDSI